MRKLVSKNQSLFLSFIAMLAIFFLPMVIMIFYGKLEFYTRWDDNDLTWFGLGLSWLSGIPRLNFHLPTMSFNMLSGVFAFLIDIDGTDKALRKFIELTNWVQIGATIIVTYVSARLAHKLELSFLSIATLACIAALMPVTIVFSPDFSNYYFMGLVAVPAVLLAFGYFTGKQEWLVPLLALSGFLSVNFYPYLFMTCVLILAIVCPPLAENRLRLRPDESLGLVKENKFFALALFVTIALPTLVLIGAFIIGKIEFSFSLGVLAPTILLLLSFILPPLVLIINQAISETVPNFLRAFKAMLIAFWAGGLVLIPFYLVPFFLAYSRKDPTPPQALDSFALAIISTPWLWVCVACLTIWVISLFLRRDNNSDVPNYLFWGAISFTALMVLVMTYISIPFHATDSHIPSRGMRIMMPLIIPIALCYLLAVRKLHKFVQYGLAGFIVLSSLFGLLQTSVAAKNRLARNLGYVEVMDAAINRFFAEHKTGILICLRDDGSSTYCHTAFGYNRYQSKAGRKAMRSRYLYDGRLIWLSFKETHKELGSVLKTIDQPVIISGKTSIYKRLNLPQINNAPQIAAAGSFELRRIQ